jgi:hypothetical protein
VKSSSGVPARMSGRKWRHSCKQCGGMGVGRLKSGKRGGRGRVDRATRDNALWFFIYIGCSFRLTGGVSTIHGGSTRQIPSHPLPVMLSGTRLVIPAGRIHSVSLVLSGYPPPWVKLPS